MKPLLRSYIIEPSELINAFTESLFTIMSSASFTQIFHWKFWYKEQMSCFSQHFSPTVQALRGYALRYLISCFSAEEGSFFFPAECFLQNDNNEVLRRHNGFL